MTVEILPLLILLTIFIANYGGDRTAEIKDSGVISEWSEIFTQHNDEVAAGNIVNPAYTVYVNNSTIRRDGDVVKMWSLVDFAHLKKITGKSYMSVKSQDEYDCKGRQYRSLHYSFFAGNMGAEEVAVKNTQPTDWYPVDSDSLVKILFNAACKKK
ncbi:MAG: hypothetical protein FD173_2147 [Gallionellaceae bacterium]|nr:MAG: hypothetical protein FD173_2147 [Gallionellaceae bacterium]